MENCLVVEYDEKNKKELYEFLKLGNFRWANGRDFSDEEHCFPFCIDTERKVVYMTNIYFLKEYKEQGYKRISVSDFINKVMAS
ncbi:MAG: hypothetical protein IKD36_02740 [Clostridia bacterium]|nr:hypothetical protein [Clostridia bacterium]